MSLTGKQSPLGVNVMSGILQGKGFWVNNPTASYVGTSTSPTSYTPGTVITKSCLYWATYSIQTAYVRGLVDKTTYYNIINMGSNTIPALGNGPPPTYTYASSPTWAPQYNYNVPPDTPTTPGANPSAVSRRPATQWGYVRLYPWQGYNEFNYNNTLALTNMYNDFCGSFISAASFIDYSNKSIMATKNSFDFLDGTYSNMNDLITADVTNVSLSPQVFGRDLINLGKALDLSTIWTFGYPSNLLATLKKYNAITPSLSVALLSVGLNPVDIDQISANSSTVTKEQQQKTYAAFLIIAGVDLAAILVSLNCNTSGLVTLADLLDVKKLFPNSYLTLTVPIYNAQPGPTNSKTYYPIFSVNSVSPVLSSPEIKAVVGTTIPPLPPPPPPEPAPTPIPPLPVVPVVTAQAVATATGGGGGGGGCPAPWIPILLADMTYIPAEKVEVGMKLWTQHETTSEWDSYVVTHVSTSNDTRWEVEFENGEKFVGTFNHRVKTNIDWIEINKLHPGDAIVALDKPMVVKSTKYFDIGEVVKITVEDAHTYITSGFLSHNIKMQGFDMGNQQSF